MNEREEILRQKQLLDIHRRTLSHYLTQKAILGQAYIPPGVTHGIRETRESIHRIKKMLQEYDVSVEDHPDDDDVDLSQKEKLFVKSNSRLESIDNLKEDNTTRGGSSIVSVFISYAREDQEKAEHLRNDLCSKGIKAWKDTHEILPGEKFEQKIVTAMGKANCVVLCLSKSSVSKVGFVQFEIKQALHLQKHRPDNQIFIIPIRFDACSVPFDLRDFHYADLFPDWNNGVKGVIASIKRYFSPN